MTGSVTPQPAPDPRHPALPYWTPPRRDRDCAEIRFATSPGQPQGRWPDAEGTYLDYTKWPWTEVIREPPPFPDEPPSVGD